MYIFLTCQSEKYTIGERFIIVLKTKQMFLIIFYAKFKMAPWGVYNSRSLLFIVLLGLAAGGGWIKQDL